MQIFCHPLFCWKVIEIKSYFFSSILSSFGKIFNLLGGKFLALSFLFVFVFGKA